MDPAKIVARSLIDAFCEGKEELRRILRLDGWIRQLGEAYTDLSLGNILLRCLTFQEAGPALESFHSLLELQFSLERTPNLIDIMKSIMPLLVTSEL